MDTEAPKSTPEEPARTEMRQTRRRERKKLKHETQRTKPPPPPPPDKSRFLARPWIKLPEINTQIQHKVRVMTWNHSVSSVSRKVSHTQKKQTRSSRQGIIPYQYLFEITPTGKDDIQRDHLIRRRYHLPSVDRLEVLIPAIQKGGYTTIYKAGRRKKHGLLIAYRGSKYTKVSDHVVFYDEEEVRDGEGEQCRRGISFRTKNIGSLVALKSMDSEGNGLIVATTHLFWHPRYTYERTRQVVILLREVVKFRNTINPNWSCIIAGDFNLTPEDPGYSLLVGDPITPPQEDLLASSRVVHSSIDPDSIPVTEQRGAKSEGDEGAEEDPDRIIVNARAATPADGLLSAEELVGMVQELDIDKLESSYDKGLKILKASGDSDVRTFGDRVTSIPTTRQGRHEPEWTSYTHFWKSVLDYIFILDPPSRISHVVGLLKPHTTEDMEPGLPQKGICGSDHVSLVSEIVWTPTTLDSDGPNEPSASAGKSNTTMHAPYVLDTSPSASSEPDLSD